MPIIETSSQSVRKWIADDRARKAYDPVTRPGLDFARKCERPVLLEVNGRPDPMLKGRGYRGHSGTIMADMYVPCRKCNECLKHRARLWTARAVDELRLSNRTWFGTITLSPEAQYMALARARRAAFLGAVDFDALDAGEQFRLRHEQIGVDLTKWLKRVRKNSGVPLRYLLVVEAHKSGLPHYHVLVHQVGEGAITKRALQDAWSLGFTQFKLVDGDPKTAFYVCKYLSKSALARVRASAGYGRGASPQFRAVTNGIVATATDGPDCHSSEAQAPVVT